MNDPRCTCREGAEECGYCARLIAECEDGPDFTETDWDRYEAGPGWHYAPGSEPRNGW